MKKIFLSALTIISFIAYGVYQRNQKEIAVQPLPQPVPISPTDAPSPTESVAQHISTAPVMPTNTPVPVSKGKYKDGTYTGSVADAFYGNIQVQAVIKNGKIATVNFLQYPNDRGRSIEINRQAMPLLSQEAIQAQSAQVDIVSGATDSSRAFIESLGSALSQAI